MNSIWASAITVRQPKTPVQSFLTKNRTNRESHTTESIRPIARAKECSLRECETSARLPNFSTKKTDSRSLRPNPPRKKMKNAVMTMPQDSAQRPPSPEKEGHSRIERQNVESAFSQCHAKEKKDPSEPYQRIEKMILCQAVTPLVEKNPKAREKQAPR